MEKSAQKNRFIPLICLYTLGLLGSTHMLQVGLNHPNSKIARVGLAGLAVSTLVAIAAGATCVLKALDNHEDDDPRIKDVEEEMKAARLQSHTHGER